MSTHPITNGVAVDRIVDEVLGGGVVQGQRPEGTGWHRQVEGQGVVVAC